MITQTKPRHTITQPYNRYIKKRKKRMTPNNNIIYFIHSSPLQQPSTIRNDSSMEHKQLFQETTRRPQNNCILPTISPLLTRNQPKIQ